MATRTITQQKQTTIQFPQTEKENLRKQEVSSSGKVPPAPVAGRKRTITLLSGAEVDLNVSFNATPEVVEAMRQRIFQLEDALEAQERPAKRAKTVSTTAAANATASSSVGPSTAGSSKADEKKRKMQLKKIFDRLKKDCKSDTCKFQGSSKTIKFDEVLDADDFELIFGGKGLLIQPTPQNKPKSTVTIIHYNSRAHIGDLFGDELKVLKGNRWSRGGVPSRSYGLFGGGGGFSKSVKQGAVDVEIRSLEVNYSKNSMKCSLKFEVNEAGGGSYMLGGFDEYDSDY